MGSQTASSSEGGGQASTRLVTEGNVYRILSGFCGPALRGHVDSSLLDRHLGFRSLRKMKKAGKRNLLAPGTNISYFNLWGCLAEKILARNHVCW